MLKSECLYEYSNLLSSIGPYRILNKTFIYIMAVCNTAITVSHDVIDS